MKRLIWKFDMAIYRLFQWRWNKRLAQSPELAAFFAEWSRRYSREHGPVAAEVQLKIDAVLNKYEVTWREKHSDAKA